MEKLEKYEANIVLCLGLLGIFMLPWLVIPPFKSAFLSRHL